MCAKSGCAKIGTAKKIEVDRKLKIEVDRKKFEVDRKLSELRYIYIYCKKWLQLEIGYLALKQLCVAVAKC